MDLQKHIITFGIHKIALLVFWDSTFYSILFVFFIEVVVVGVASLPFYVLLKKILNVVYREAIETGITKIFRESSECSEEASLSFEWINPLKISKKQRCTRVIAAFKAIIVWCVASQSILYLVCTSNLLFYQITFTNFFVVGFITSVWLFIGLYCMLGCPLFFFFSLKDVLQVKVIKDGRIISLTEERLSKVAGDINYLS